MRTRSQAGRSTVRFATIATALLVSTSALAACSSGGTATSTSSRSGSNGSSSGPVTLVVPTSQAPWNPAYAVVVKAYEKATGNTVDLRPFPNPDVKTQEVNDVQGQQHVFDVYQVNESDIAQFNVNGWLEPFTKIDPNYTPDPALFSYSNIGRWDTATGNFSKDGLITSAPLLGNVDIFMYRTDIYSKLGLQVPKTWDDVIANGKKIAQANAAKYGGVFRTQGIPGAYAMGYEFQALLNSAGGSWFKDQGTNYTPTADTPAAIKAATWLRELAQLGPAATTTIGQAQAIAAMQSGDAAQTYAVAAAAAQLEDPAKSSVAGKIGYAPLPTTPTGESSSATGLWVLGVPSGLPENRARAALDFIKWMTSKEAMTLFAENGGIPTRSDAYDASGLSPAATAALAAVKETAANLPEVPTSLRYTFAGDMLNITETEEQGIAAGTATPADGMKTIQQQLTDLVKKLKLPVG
jgi:multiple sugar transport system substrate-binding protein